MLERHRDMIASVLRRTRAQSLAHEPRRLKDSRLEADRARRGAVLVQGNDRVAFVVVLGRMGPSLPELAAERASEAHHQTPCTSVVGQIAGFPTPSPPVIHPASDPVTHQVDAAVPPSNAAHE